MSKRVQVIIGFVYSIKYSKLDYISENFANPPRDPDTSGETFAQGLVWVCAAFQFYVSMRMSECGMIDGQSKLSIVIKLRRRQRMVLPWVSQGSYHTIWQETVVRTEKHCTVEPQLREKAMIAVVVKSWIFSDLILWENIIILYWHVQSRLNISQVKINNVFEYKHLNCM